MPFTSSTTHPSHARIVPTPASADTPRQTYQKKKQLWKSKGQDLPRSVVP
ncbi:predicted protein [Plenodomus lingam JN3]|uniref:Predicted protein n=1 Tax=Leptosphaeria maculans (strain JN3 / isolate v23.1.3 / race Av1-4-5-6-7-8) TaxID=985895 RepID=E5A8D8_LEPMJ|nr:predicted protein [Plenodomus lingam JN3]CBX99883.1 predicted protein [Plenodomus lingam JN3]